MEGKAFRQRMGSWPLRMHAAFTFVELVVVVAVLGVFSAIAVPRFTGFLSQKHLEEAARRIVMDLALARQQAQRTGTSQTIQFLVSSDRYQIIGLSDFDRPGQGYAVVLGDDPYQVTLTSAILGSDSAVIFDPYGMSDSGGVIGLRRGDRQITITLSAETGKATMGKTMPINTGAIGTQPLSTL